MSFTSVTERQPSLAWDFNGTTTDYVSGLTGTTTGTATYNSGGKYGQSLIMNGSSYVKYSKTLGYNLGTGGATFAMWFKLLAIPVGTNFWIFGASGTSYSDRIYILVGTTGYIGWTFIDNTLSGKVLSSPSPLVVGTWTHLTFSLFNGTMTMYINGSQVATRSDAPMSGVVLDTQFSIAALAGGSGNNINAEYDDFRIFDRALTSIQVNDIYNQQGMPGRGMVSIQTPQGISLSGAPLFNQLSPAATSSAVGAFSLRAVNGVSTRAVNVAPGGTFPPSAMTQTGTNLSTQTLGTGGKFQGSYIASSSRSNYGWGASGAFSLSSSGLGPGIWQVNNYPVGGGSLSTPTTTTTGATNYNGEWLQFQTPFPINLTGYSALTGHFSSVVLLASTTGATSSWTLVDSKSAVTGGSTITNTGLNFAGYSYFRFVVITSTNIYPLLGNVRFFGTVPSLAQDFYADERGNLLTAPVVGTTLQNWLGSATGYVTTWYDQSGRGNHMSCSSVGIQPKIDTANAWLDFKTAAYFDTSANPASGPVPYSNTMNYTIICRHNTIGNNAGGICGSAQTNNNNYTNNFRRAGAAYQSYWFSNDQTAGTYATGNRVTFKWDGTNRYIYGNGTLQSTQASSNWWQTSSTAQQIGKTTNDATMNGEMYSIFMFNTSLSDSDRILVENFS